MALLRKLRGLIAVGMALASTSCGPAIGNLPQFADLSPDLDGMLAGGDPAVFNRDEFVVTMEAGRDVSPVTASFGLQVKRRVVFPVSTSPELVLTDTYVLEPGPGYRETVGDLPWNASRAGLSGWYHFRSERSAMLYNTFCKIKLRSSELGVSTVFLNALASPA